MKSISPVILPSVEEMGKAAADYSASILREMLLTRERVNLVVATGASQFTVLSNLISQPDIDWSRVHGFHLDEYVGMSEIILPLFVVICGKVCRTSAIGILCEYSWGLS